MTVAAFVLALVAIAVQVTAGVVIVKAARQFRALTRPKAGTNAKAKAPSARL